VVLCFVREGCVGGACVLRVVRGLAGVVAWCCFRLLRAWVWVWGPLVSRWLGCQWVDGLRGFLEISRLSPFLWLDACISWWLCAFCVLCFLECVRCCGARRLWSRRAHCCGVHRVCLLVCRRSLLSQRLPVVGRLFLHCCFLNFCQSLCDNKITYRSFYGSGCFRRHQNTWTLVRFFLPRNTDVIFLLHNCCYWKNVVKEIAKWGPILCPYRQNICAGTAPWCWRCSSRLGKQFLDYL